MAYIIAEIGQNHNGDMDNVKKLIDVAYNAGCDAVKFQKRTMGFGFYKGSERETPWGVLPYEQYRERLELSLDAYDWIDGYCNDIGIDWFCSIWDIPALDWYEKYFSHLDYIKIPSAKIHDEPLLKEIGERDFKPILSTGGSTYDDITKAISHLKDPILMHCISVYPCPNNKLNLKMIQTLQRRYGLPVGYSGHEVGVPTTVSAVALGATVVERHITLDRTMWGTDQSASLEPHGLEKLVKDIRTIETALGTGRREILPEEQKKIESLK